MNYIITEDTTAGFEFWSNVCKYLLDNKYEVLDIIKRGTICGIGVLADYAENF